MNHMAAHARRASGGWLGMFRCSDKSGYYPVTEAGQPRIFRTAMEAENAALRAIVKHVNGTLTSTGEKAVASAERAFGAIFKGGQRIPVEVKGKRRVGK